jgi:RNA polymerase sigma-70 factor (ECF subfamily)
MDYSLLPDEALVGLMKHEDKGAFRVLYERYWKEILLVAYRKTGTKEIAEELTQNLFLNLWERRATVEIQHVRAWLFTAIKFSIINHYKSQIVHEKFVSYVQHTASDYAHTTEQTTIHQDLSQAIDKGIALLPEKTQQVFKLSRFENRSIKEIARDLNISEKAVEYHITQSLKRMRVHLKDYLIYGFLLIYLL